MPTTINGIGTHYYGKKNTSARDGQCAQCNRHAKLQSYDTRLFAVFVFIPIIPLGRKRIIDQCSICSRHWVVPLHEFEATRQNKVTTSQEQYAAEPSPEAAIEVHGTLLGFQLFAEAAAFREKAVATHPQSQHMLAVFAMQLDDAGDPKSAAPLYEQALKLCPELPEARMGVARSRIHEGRVEQAHELLRFLEEPGAGATNDVSQLELLAQAYEKRTQPDEALRLCEVILREWPHAKDVEPFSKFVRRLETSAHRGESLLPKAKWSLFGAVSDAVGSNRGRVVWGGIAALAVIAVVLGVNEYKRRHRTVFIVNAYGEPVQVTIDGGPSITVAERQEISLGEGTHQVVVAGAAVDSFDITLETPFFSRWTKKPVWVINVNGLYPIELGTIYYAVNPQPPTFELLMGEKFVFVEHVDYAFETLPDEIDVPSATAQVAKISLGMAGYTPAMIYQVANATLTPLNAINFAASHLRQRPVNEDLLETFGTVAQESLLRERMIDILRDGLWQTPISTAWHRTYQSLIDGTDAEPQLREAYDAAISKEPSSAELLYLRGRIASSRSESREYFQKSREARNDYAWPWYAFAYDDALQGNWASARSNIDKTVEFGLDDPSSTALHVLTLMATDESSQLEEALRVQSQTAQLADAARSIVSLCDVLVDQGRRNTALQEYNAWQDMILAGGDPTGLQFIRRTVDYMCGKFASEAEADDGLPVSLQIQLRLAAGDSASAFAIANQQKVTDLLCRKARTLIKPMSCKHSYEADGTDE